MSNDWFSGLFCFNICFSELMYCLYTTVNQGDLIIKCLLFDGEGRK